MPATREEPRTGIDALETATALLQRVRRAHPTRGLYEAADLQWWWRTPRATDELTQLFWFDDDGRPEAALLANAEDDGTTLVPIVLPDATPDRRTGVVERGLSHAARLGLGALELEVARSDHVLRDVLTDHDFTVVKDGVVEAWLAAAARPGISRLPEGYRLRTRLDTMARPHHLAARSGREVETRLRQTSLYRPDLDLVVLDGHDTVAAYGVFWFDPETGTGLVEPMRTEDDHRRRGLARHVLTAGVHRLAAVGAARIKICFEPANAASSALYLDVGFEPVTRTDVFRARTGGDAAAGRYGRS